MKKVTEAAIVWLLLLSAIFSLFYVQFTEDQVGYPFYIGITAIVVVFILRIKFKNIYKYFLAFILFLGAFNFIQFSFVEIEFEVSLNSFGVNNFNPIVLLFFIVFVVSNLKEFLSIRKKNSIK